MRQHLADFGYVIVTDAVNPSMMGELLAAGRRVAPRVRSGELNNRMLTPLDGEPIFAEYYACPELLRYALRQPAIRPELRVAAHHALGKTGRPPMQ